MKQSKKYQKEKFVMNKRFLSILLAVVMVFTMIPLTAFANGNALLTLEELREEKGAITVEAYNIGHGFLVEPSLYTKEGKSTGDITVDFLTSKNINYQGSTSYFSGFEFDDTVAPQYPDYLEPYLGELNNEGDGNGYLAEFDYSQYAGWVYTINDWWASLGADSSVPGQEITDYNTGEPVVLGDIIRWHYTVYGYGADCGFPSNVMAEYMGGNLFTQEDKSDLIFILAAINDYYGNLATDNVYETALAVAADPLATADDITAQEAALTSYIENTFFGNEETPREAQDVSAVLNAVMAQLATTVAEPSFSSTGGEWTVLSLARGEYYAKNNAYFTGYYNRIVEMVNETAASVNLNGALQKNKSTENSRLIVALSSIGKDATAVGDWNLVTPYNDFDWIKKQGINGPIWALIALDSNGYVTTDSTIRQQCVDYILEKQLDDGGWALSGTTADPDMTGMALQALRAYKDQSAVSAAAEEAFNRLSSIQNDNGGYASWGTVNSESCAQVIVACTAWGINPDTDSRFIKNDNSVVDALLDHYLENEALFEHVANSGSDLMATEQATYALVAYKRFMNSKTALYDMSDVTFEGKDEVVVGKPKATLGLPAQITDDIGKTFNATISLDQWDNTAGYKLIDFIVDVPEGLSVTAVTAGNRLGGGTVNYNLEAGTGKLRVVYFDANNHSDITVSGNAFPAQFFTVTFKVDVANEGDKLGVNISGMSIKLNSDSTEENAMIIVDTANATGSIDVVKGISYSAVCLYTGDDVDLIPSTKKAIAVSVVGIENATKLTYNDGTNEYEFKYSAEITEKTGVATYVALVDASIDMIKFATKTNFTFTEDTASEITFGDSNGDGVINAQDALAAVDTWLRKTDAPDDAEILALNVNSDSRINTFDALGIVEAFVDDSEYLIVTKAATLSTNN
ncbi:MAG: hypothetical protein J6A55_06990 [Oscillospiraceae bacterium]|nr:hypothetical protein [Oscillospiraceae bacterium]